MKEKCKYQLNNFKKTIDKLTEVLNRDLKDDDIILDAAIQRFEFTYEQAWKSVKRILKYKGEDCLSPRDCIKKAYKHGWIKEERVFLEFLNCRNLTVHTYNLKVAMKVYNIIKNNYKVFEKLHKRLEKEI